MQRSKHRINPSEVLNIYRQSVTNCNRLTETNYHGRLKTDDGVHFTEV